MYLNFEDNIILLWLFFIYFVQYITIYLYHGKYDFIWFRKFAKIANNIEQSAIVSGKKQITICSISDLSKRFFINKFESNLIII